MSYCSPGGQYRRIAGPIWRSPDPVRRPSRRCAQLLGDSEAIGGVLPTEAPRPGAADQRR
jgi:hypothetical protein